MNWTIVSLVVAAAVVLVIYLVRQNRRDRRNYEKFLDRQDQASDQRQDSLDE